MSLPDEAFVRRHVDLINKQYVELGTSLSEPFVFPSECLTQDAMTRVMLLIRESLEASHDIGEFLIQLESALGPSSHNPVTDDVARWHNARGVLKVLYEQVHRLHIEGRDGIWVEIIKNRFAPLLIGKFDLVVGNPPWVTFTKLPETWRRRAEPIWRNYGMFDAPRIPGVEEPRSLHTSDLAVLVTAIAIDRYLRPGGLLAFVLPKALINGDPGNRAFRTYHLNSKRDELARRNVDLPFSVLAIADFSEVRPFSPDAANSPAVIVIRSGEETVFPIPGERWERRADRTTLPSETWDVIRRLYLRSTQVQWVPISSYPASPLAWWLPDETPMRGKPSPFVYGKGFDTRGANGIYFVEIRRPVNSEGLITIRNQAEMGRDRDVSARTGTVEASLIAPVIRGRDVRPFSAKPSTYLLLPHAPDDRGRSLTNRELLDDYPGARRFLGLFKNKLIKRRPYLSFKPSEECWWQVQGVEHMDSGFLVCIPEITEQPTAAVISASWDEKLGRTVLPILDHKIVFYNTHLPEEAYYLAGMINSVPLQTLIQRFANFISISPNTLKYLPIPAFTSVRLEVE